MNEIIQKICGDINDDFIVHLHMENGAAWVTLEDVVMEIETHIDGGDLTLEQQLNEALDTANKSKRNI